MEEKRVETFTGFMNFKINHPESLSRGILLLKTFLGWLYIGIPHGIILGLMEVGVGVVTFIAWWAILFTGKYPEGMYNFVEGYYRWALRVGAYMGLLTDDMPPYSMDPKETSPVTFKLTYPESLSRGKVILKVLLGWLYVGIPHGIVLGLYGILVSIISFIAWWAILFTGKYPKGMFELVEGYIRWSLRVMLYLGLMTDEYPPFSKE